MRPQRRQHVEAERAAEMDEAEPRRRLERSDLRGRLSDGAIGNREKEDA